MKRTVFAVSLFLAGGTLLFADINAELNKILAEKTAQALQSKGTLQNSSYRKAGTVLQLVPNIAFIEESKNIPQVPDTPFFVENLYLYKKTSGKVGPAGNDVAKISSILRSLSRLEGIQYYSTSRKKMRTLYEKSYVVDGAKTKKRIPDPVDGSAEGMKIIALQKDLTFGEYLYQYSYRETADTVAFFSENLEPMSLSFIKLIDPENLRVSLVVYDMGDSLLVYGLTCADFPAIPGLESKISASFSTRADAIYKWFISEYEK